MSKPKDRRQSVSFSDPAAIYLKREARRLGITVSEMVRRIVDEHRTRRKSA
jgi:hypothetical protein